MKCEFCIKTEPCMDLINGTLLPLPQGRSPRVELTLFGILVGNGLATPAHFYFLLKNSAALLQIDLNLGVIHQIKMAQRYLKKCPLAGIF